MSVDSLTLKFIRGHPRDAVRTLQQLADEEVVPLLSRIPAADAASILRLFAPHVAARCLAELAPEAAAPVVEQLSTDIASVLLRRMERGDRQALLSAMSTTRAASLRLALRYSDAVVGSVLDPEILTVAGNMTVRQVMAMIQERGERVEDRLFIIDDRQRLTGTVEMKKLLVAEPEKRMQDLAEPPAYVFSARAALNAVRQDPAWGRMGIAPVVDHNGVLLGGLSRDALQMAHSAIGRDDRPGDLLDSIFELAETMWGALADLFVHGEKAQGGKRSGL